MMKAQLWALFTILCINVLASTAFAEPSSCRYVSEGAFQNSWKKVRIQNLSGEIVGGVDLFSEALYLGENLINSKICKAQLQDCRMASEGLVGGVQMAHRLQMDQAMILGAENLPTALNQLSVLRRLGYCQ